MTHLNSPLNWVLATLIGLAGLHFMWRMMWRDGPHPSDMSRFGLPNVLAQARAASKNGIWGTVLIAVGAATAGDAYGAVMLWVAVVCAVITIPYRWAITAHTAARQGVSTPWVVFWWIAVTLTVALASAGAQMSNAAMANQSVPQSIDVMRTAAVTAVAVTLIGLALMTAHLTARRRRHRRPIRRPGSATRARFADPTSRQTRKR